MNKRGQPTENLFTLIVISFILVILIGAFLFIYGEVNSSLQGNLQAGAVNLSNASSQTIGAINSSFLSSADLIGVFFIFGVIIAIMLNGFLTRNQTPKIFFIMDFIIILLAYIVAVYMANQYESLLTTLSFSNLLISNVNKTSLLILNLPILTVVTGFITMILTYAGIPRQDDEVVPGI